jgi:hypothetical protein
MLFRSIESIWLAVDSPKWEILEFQKTVACASPLGICRGNREDRLFYFGEVKVLEVKTEICEG